MILRGSTIQDPIHLRAQYWDQAADEKASVAHPSVQKVTYVPARSVPYPKYRPVVSTDRARPKMWSCAMFSERMQYAKSNL